MYYVMLHCTEVVQPIALVSICVLERNAPLSNYVISPSSFLHLKLNYVVLLPKDLLIASVRYVLSPSNPAK